MWIPIRFGLNVIGVKGGSQSNPSPPGCGANFMKRSPKRLKSVRYHRLRLAATDGLSKSLDISRVVGYLYETELKI